MYKGHWSLQHEYFFLPLTEKHYKVKVKVTILHIWIGCFYSFHEEYFQAKVKYSHVAIIIFVSESCVVFLASVFVKEK